MICWVHLHLDKVMGSPSEYVFQRPDAKTDIKYGKFWSERGSEFEGAGRTAAPLPPPPPLPTSPTKYSLNLIVADKYCQASEMAYFICNSLTNFLTSAHILMKGYDTF